MCSRTPCTTPPAVFEGERAYGGVVFKSREHSERLHKSAHLLGFKLPYSVEELDRAKAELVKKQGCDELLSARACVARLGADGRLGQAR